MRAPSPTFGLVVLSTAALLTLPGCASKARDHLDYKGMGTATAEGMRYALNGEPPSYLDWIRDRHNLWQSRDPRYDPRATADSADPLVAVLAAHIMRAAADRKLFRAHEDQIVLYIPDAWGDVHRLYYVQVLRSEGRDIVPCSAVEPIFEDVRALREPTVEHFSRVLLQGTEFGDLVFVDVYVATAGWVNDYREMEASARRAVTSGRIPPVLRLVVPVASPAAERSNLVD